MIRKFKFIDIFWLIGWFLLSIFCFSIGYTKNNTSGYVTGILALIIFIWILKLIVKNNKLIFKIKKEGIHYIAKIAINDEIKTENYCVTSIMLYYFDDLEEIHFVFPLNANEFKNISINSFVEISLLDDDNCLILKCLSEDEVNSKKNKPLN